ncbi:YbjQ family protein [Peptoniphilus equinus]|uniref:UPF0145 protein O6R05_05640 n=1 Tax=Peptoniphilus equinus TaxID=3016343 RepID=A0ABY7QRR8_9FIRM|nr:YbjQ family protein [Peptoniphilus equinus]WBW49491.1 YbjQ family protein [Peptoniphilus equinus]
MLLSTTSTIEGHTITSYLGLVYGETINGINFMKDIGAGFRNFVGGRSAGYESELLEARNTCMDEMIRRAQDLGADGIVGININVEALGQGNMILVNVVGTAVRFS